MTNNLFILQNALHNQEFAKTYANSIKPAYFIDETGFPVDAHADIFEIIQKHYLTYGDLPQLSTVNDAVLAKYPTPEAEYVEVLEELGQPFTAEGPAYTSQKASEFIELNAMRSAFARTAERLHDFTGNRAQLVALFEDLHASTKISVMRDRGLGKHDHETYAEAMSAMNKNRVPFLDQHLNRALNGGFAGGTLNVYCAASGVGKTAIMISQMADNLRDGRNVFYACVEEDRAIIRNKLLSNLSGVPIYQLDNMSNEDRIKVSRKTFEKLDGDFVIQTFPAGANMRDVEAFIDQLGIEFDIFYFDYINLFYPNKPGKNDNLYMNMQHVTSEMKLLAAKYERPVVTATQTNRSGISAKDPGQADVSQSVRVFELSSFFAFILEGDYERANHKALIKIAKSRGDLRGYRAIHQFYDKSTSRFSECLDQSEADREYHGVPEGETRQHNDTPPTFNFDENDDGDIILLPSPTAVDTGENVEIINSGESEKYDEFKFETHSPQTAINSSDIDVDDILNDL